MKNEAEQRDDRIDNLIDRALKSYTPQEPEPGLEQRILSGVVTVNRPCPHRDGRTWRFSWALAAAALVVLALLTIPFGRRLLSPASAVDHRTIRPTEQLSARVLAPQTVATGAQHDSRIAVWRSESESRIGSVAKSRLRAAKATASGESMAFAPIELKPIVIAPIKIPTLN